LRLKGEGEKLRLIEIADGQRAQTNVLGEDKVYQLAVLDKVLEAAVFNTVTGQQRGKAVVSESHRSVGLFPHQHPNGQIDTDAALAGQELRTQIPAAGKRKRRW